MVGKYGRSRFHYAERETGCTGMGLRKCPARGWSIVQKLRSYPQYCKLPLLLFQENALGNSSGESSLTNVLLKPAGKLMLEHVLNLLPQAAPSGEIWIIDDDFRH